MNPRLHAQALAEALRRMAGQPVATATFVVVLGLALAIPLVAALMLRSVSAAASHLDTDPHVNVYLALDASDEDAKRVEQALKASSEAAAVRFVPKAQALAELKSTTHLAEVLASLDRNPLPHAFTVRVRSAEPARLATLKAAWLQLPKVEQVVADFEWSQRLARWVRFGERVVYAIGTLLGLAILFVVGQLIRLQVVTPPSGDRGEPAHRRYRRRRSPPLPLPRGDSGWAGGHRSGRYCRPRGDLAQPRGASTNTPVWL
jgi:cell division transport system permease protein